MIYVIKRCNSTQDHVLFKQNSDNKKIAKRVSCRNWQPAPAIRPPEISQQSEVSQIINKGNAVCLICIRISLGRKIDWKSPERGKTFSTGSTRLANNLLRHTWKNRKSALTKHRFYRKLVYAVLKSLWANSALSLISICVFVFNIRI